MPKTEAGPARRILLVEDHPVERAYLQNMLLAPAAASRAWAAAPRRWRP